MVYLTEFWSFSCIAGRIKFKPWSYFRWIPLVFYNSKNKPKATHPVRKFYSTVALNIYKAAGKAFCGCMRQQCIWEIGNKLSLIYWFLTSWTTAECEKIKRLLRAGEEGKTKQNCQYRQKAWASISEGLRKLQFKAHSNHTHRLYSSRVLHTENRFFFWSFSFFLKQASSAFTLACVLSSSNSATTSCSTPMCPSRYSST